MTELESVMAEGVDLSRPSMIRMGLVDDRLSLTHVLVPVFFASLRFCGKHVCFICRASDRSSFPQGRKDAKSSLVGRR